jgi:hypothetical protein
VPTGAPVFILCTGMGNGKVVGGLRTVAEGAVAGVAAGALMALFFSVIMVDGSDLLAPLRLMVSPFSSEADPGAPLRGLAVHLLVSAMLGDAFALCIRPRVGASNTLAWGVLWGAGLFVAVSCLVLPWANAPLLGAVRQQPWPYFLAHLTFGATLAFFLAAWRSRRILGRAVRGMA